MAEDGAMSEAVNTILTQIKSVQTEASEVEPTNVLEETVAPEIQFAKFEKNFGVSNSSVLKNNLPQLFQIIDTISEKNTIYGRADLVNNLLTNVLFSELIKTDSKLKNFYNTIETDPITNQESKTEESVESEKSKQSKEYKSLNINYIRQDTQDTYTIEYPDFLDDAFETIKNKIKKIPDYNDIVSITTGSSTAADEATDVVTVAATDAATDPATDVVTDAATVAATVTTTDAATVAVTDAATDVVTDAVTVAPGNPPL